jgi:trans-aconitate 2-methyltransferase
VTGPAPFAASDFSAPAARSRWFAEQVVRRARAESVLRVLDVGCGTGEHVFALAERMPRATLHGVDVSAANIEQAERARSASAAAGRISFACADYLQHRADVFDLIISDSSLHLIPGPTPALLQKIAADLAPNGLLVASLPDCGVFNRSLWALRRLLGALRSRWLDDLALAISLRVYRGRYDEAFLRQRLPYLYLLPNRCEGPALRDAARACGLDWQGSEPAPHDSVMQPVHVLVTYRRAAT